MTASPTARQLLGWSLPQRGRYASFQALCSIPAAYLSGWLLRVAGARRTLLGGQGVAVLERRA